MESNILNKDFFSRNRKKLSKKLKYNSIAIIFSNDIMPTNADGTLPYFCNNHLYYLTGIVQEETIFMMAPDFPDKKYKEILFLRKTDENIKIWEGHKHSLEEGKEVSGIDNVMWIDDFENVLKLLLSETLHIYLYKNEHIRNSSKVETANDRFIKWCMNQYPLYHYERLAPLLYELRSIKSEEEITILKTACEITNIGFKEVIQKVKPGIWEYEIEAEFAYHFIKNRSRGFAYTPIIAGGINSCILHYIENNRQLKENDVLLLDVGAEFGHYNADMTRTIPVSGKFTKRQKEVYQAVLNVKNKATQLLIADNTIPKYHEQVGEIMTEELLKLGLITTEEVKNQDPKRPAFKKYFMHGCSHHLGLDVHDVASVYKPIENGMVFTVEPGIYIPEEGFGIRLEDNVLITENGQVNLMENIPIEIEEIEELMK